VVEGGTQIYPMRMHSTHRGSQSFGKKRVLIYSTSHHQHKHAFKSDFRVLISCQQLSPQFSSPVREKFLVHVPFNLAFIGLHCKEFKSSVLKFVSATMHFRLLNLVKFFPFFRISTRSNDRNCNRAPEQTNFSTKDFQGIMNAALWRIRAEGLLIKLANSRGFGLDLQILQVTNSFINNQQWVFAVNTWN